MRVDSMWTDRAQKRSVLTRSNIPLHVQTQNPSYDAESGQVYTETTVPLRSRQHSDWIGEVKTPSLSRRPQLEAKGSRSLSAIAKSKTACEFRYLTSEHFTSIPWPIAQQVWQELVQCRVESFHAWRILAATYSDSHEFGSPAFRYFLDLRQPSLPLENYFSGITSPDTAWLTALRISPKETRIADLVSVAKISNITVLDLSDGQNAICTTASPFDERVMRTWAELALSGSFRHLQVLMLGWQENLDHWIFRYLSNFCKLRQVILTDCPKMHQKNRKDWESVALEYGWEARHAKKSAKSLRPYLNEPKFTLGAVSGLYYTDATSDAWRPVLECWIGTPRSWTHIVEDFPGTRTVFFDRIESKPPSEQAPSRLSQVTKRMRDQNNTSSTATSPEPKRPSRPELRAKPGPTCSLADIFNQLDRV